MIHGSGRRGSRSGGRLGWLSRALSYAWIWAPLCALILGGAQCTADSESGLFGLRSGGLLNNASSSSAGSGLVAPLVGTEQKISAASGGFNGDLNRGDEFGSAVAELGDLEGDGVTDLAVGVPLAVDGGPGRGAVWLLFMDSDGRVDVETRISDTEGDFSGDLDDGDAFGSALGALGDLDGDGFLDLAVGAPGDDDAGADKGAVWILFLRGDGTVRAEQKISAEAGGFDGDLDRGDRFGSSVTAIGDLDGDGTTDLAVGAVGDDAGRADAGAVWILFMAADGTVASSLRIARSAGGFEGDLNQDDRFGSAVAKLGDLDGDGVGELVVGADGDDDGGREHGAVWILFLNTDGTVDRAQKISSDAGRFDGNLDADDRFGGAVAGLGDLDEDGVVDLAVGAAGDDDGGLDRGALWILLLDADARVDRVLKVSETEGRFRGELDDGDRFGSALATIGDLDGDGVPDLAVGTPGDDDRGEDKGAVWVLFLDRP